MKSFTMDLGETFNLYVISDLHFENPNTDYKALNDARDRIKKDPKGYCIIPGDLIDAETIKHKFYRPDIKKTIVTPMEAMKDLYNFLKPIQKKILVIGDGNHELRLLHFGNFCSHLSDLLGARYGEYTFRINFRYKSKKMFNLFWTHGRKPIISYAADPRIRQASLEMQLIRRLKFKMGDCLIMGRSHCHKLLVVPPNEELFLYEDKNGLQGSLAVGRSVIPTSTFIPYECRWYIQSGGFLRLYSYSSPSYGESLDLDPNSIGFIKICIEKKEIKDVHVIEYL